MTSKIKSHNLGEGKKKRGECPVCKFVSKTPIESNAWEDGCEDKFRCRCGAEWWEGIQF